MLDCFSLGRLVEMKIHYREPTVLEQIADAIRDSKKPIDYIELTSEELNSYYSNFDRTIKDKIIYYSYRGIPLKVKE
jgi:hypothetical protein